MGRLDKAAKSVRRKGDRMIFLDDSMFNLTRMMANSLILEGALQASPTSLREVKGARTAAYQLGEELERLLASNAEASPFFASEGEMLELHSLVDEQFISELDQTVVGRARLEHLCKAIDVGAFDAKARETVFALARASLEYRHKQHLHDVA